MSVNRRATLDKWSTPACVTAKHSPVHHLRGLPHPASVSRDSHMDYLQQTYLYTRITGNTVAFKGSVIKRVCNKLFVSF